MTDRELLEMAAKAAGLLDGEHDWQHGVLRMHRDGVTIYWNPLIDDADALRLAVKLNMSVSMGPLEVGANTIAGALRSAFFRQSRITQDPCAATRRVIVLAAAEVGRSM